MEVFVGNLHDSVAYRDIALLFKNFKQPQVRMMEQPRGDGGPIRYAVVSFDSDRLAKKAISRLDGRLVNGQPLVVREFYHRTYVNERRALDWRQRAWSAPERRRLDRRKGQMLHAQESPLDAPPVVAEEAESAESASAIRIEGYRDFARKH